MNRIIRNLVIAVPLVTVGFTMVNTGAAVAGPNGPIVIGIPEDKPEPHPGPKFDNDLPLSDKPEPKDPKPQPKPKPQAEPTGPITVPQAADETDKVEKKKAKKVVSAKGSPDSIDRSEDLFASEAFETELVVAEDTDGGLDLAWLLVGGGIVTASGLALAARKRSNA